MDARQDRLHHHLEQKIVWDVNGAKPLALQISSVSVFTWGQKPQEAWVLLIKGEIL
tara:strand:- start:224 stop:391 length:168 start_codon:yes stop_codon:yes gene_type:complete